MNDQLKKLRDRQGWMDFWTFVGISGLIQSFKSGIGGLFGCVLMVLAASRLKKHAEAGGGYFDLDDDYDDLDDDFIDDDFIDDDFIDDDFIDDRF